jgi:NDP-sugar pyrophosphorylase family protein
MHAVILAGGEGRRLRPYTTILPKPLMPLGGQPILEIIVGQLKKAGFDRLTFAVGYLAGLLQAYFGDGRRFGVAINYSVEERTLGTAGPLSLLENPDDHFLVMNGDVLTNLDYAQFVQNHVGSGATATLAVFQKEVPITLGVLNIDEQSNVIGYTEKPTLHYPVSTGIYCFRSGVLGYLEKGVHCDLPDLIKRLVAADETVRAYHFEGIWLDIGRPEDYEVALAKFGKDSV